MSFDPPIDALSIRMESGETTSVRGWDGEKWTTWEPLAIEEEFDPMLQESNLVMFPRPIRMILIRGNVHMRDIHPIRITRDPVIFTVAARAPAKRPRILSRQEWGADPTYLYEGPNTARSDVPEGGVTDERKGNGEHGNGNGTGEAVQQIPQRVTDCTAMQEQFSEEFRLARTVRADADGKSYRWPVQFSRRISLLVVHHTALKVGGDGRSGVERVRALYAYHSNNRGWGDIGYNYLIDEDGQIYEGRQGGDGAVGGHAYCWNTGTVGIALLGNFEMEKPMQVQIGALQWLLKDLAERHGLSLEGNVRFHGKELSPIIGHRDLLSTDCPGYYAYGVMAQVRDNVRSGDVRATVAFPAASKKITSRTPARRAVRQSRGTGVLPRRVLRNLQKQSSRLLRRKLRDIKEHFSERRPPAKERFAPKKMKTGGREHEGTGVWEYGTKNEDTPSPVNGWGERLPIIRIRLSATGTDILVSTASADPVGIRSSSTKVLVHRYTELLQEGNACLMKEDETVRRDSPQIENDRGIVRIGTLTGSIATIDGIASYRGIIECRVVEGALTIINELPLEDYLAGLNEEPDTEHPEKQRAFAIAARSYALHYLNPAHRKFPGLPYDGSDDPAVFQSYAGARWEAHNPSWIRAVRDTAGQVLTVGGAVIRPPYFSSDDGRTRAPAEAGWTNFPFAEVFASKPDPWCDGLLLRGHGVGMSGCGAAGQAREGKSAEDILRYYYPGTTIDKWYDG